MPSDHVSNTDYHNQTECTPTMEYGFYIDYESLKIQKLKLQFRCSHYKTALEKALDWLKEHTYIPSDTNISNLSDSVVWERLSKQNETGLE